MASSGRSRTSSPACIYSTSSKLIPPRSALSSFRRRPTSPPATCSAILNSSRPCNRRSSRSRTGQGSTRERTHDLVIRIQARTNLTAVSHLTCVCHGIDELASILERYAASELNSILALGGDPPQPGRLRPRATTPSSMRKGWSGSSNPAHPRLTPRVRRWGRRLSRRASFDAESLERDGLPEAEGRRGGQIISAPSSSSPTRTFYDFRERCEFAGIKVPILAGIMPITRDIEHQPDGRAQPSVRGSRPGSCERSTGAAMIPRLASKVGIHWATEQCRDLLDNNVRGCTSIP